MNATSSVSQRRYDLDWLRVLTILVVFLFHSTRFFDLWGWHVKNPGMYQGVTDWNDFLLRWMMPIIFVISGASIYYALNKGGAGKFLKDKVLRLLVPLVVGVFTHAALQVYLERISQGQFQGSFWQFLPHYFEGLYPFTGNFAFAGMHLWYLMALFLFCVIFLPVFLWLKKGGQGVLRRMGDLLALPGGVFLLVIPTALLVIVLDPEGIGFRDTGGWNLLVYILYFLPGFVLVSHEKLQARVQQQRWISLAVAVVASLAYLAQDDPAFGTLDFALVSVLSCLAGWSWIFTFFGFAMKHLTFTNPFLKYANEAVLPFYIMHQTVLLVIGYFVVRWDLPALAKWAIIASSSFVLILLAYEFVVRRFNVVRVLFGMKWLPRRAEKQVDRHVTQPAD